MSTEVAPAPERATLSTRAGHRLNLPATSFGLLLTLMVAAFVGLGLLDGAGGVLWSDVIEAFGVSKGGFGLLSGFGLAVSFPVLLFGGRLADRFDKRLLLALSFVGMGLASLGLMTGTGGIVVFAVSLLLRSASIALLDLSNNALAMDYEQQTGSHIMSPLHGSFSGGTMLGAGIVWLALAAGGGFRAVYIGLAAIFAVAALWAVKVRGASVLPRHNADQHASPAVALSLLRRGDIRWFAAITGLAFGGEVLISQWASIFLRDERHFSARVGVYAVGAYGLAMLIGRLTNGPLTVLLGPRVVILLQGVATLIGGVLIVAGGPVAIPVAGCGLAGLGLAGRVLPNATAAASGATLAGGYLGFAGAPVMAGAIAAVGSARIVMAGVALAGLIVAVISFRLPASAATDG